MKLILLSLMYLFASASYADECKGHIIFYTLADGDGEADIDFSYYYHKSTPWLNEDGYSTSAHTETPIKTNTCFADNVIVPSEIIKLSLGYVFVKPSLEMEVHGGVMTGVDLSNAINEFYR
jgi:hypothetical protein